MGLFDKLKAVKNVITGGAAKVYVDCDNFSLNEPFRVTVRALIDDAPVKMSRAYLYIKGEEQIEVPDTDVVFDEEGGPQRRTETVYASHETLRLDITVADGEELQPHQAYKWEVEVELPSSAPQIYRGCYCQHVYSMYAGLDCFGNDPDSGWVELNA